MRLLYNTTSTHHCPYAPASPAHAQSYHSKKQAFPSPADRSTHQKRCFGYFRWSNSEGIKKLHPLCVSYCFDVPNLNQLARVVQLYTVLPHGPPVPRIVNYAPECFSIQQAFNSQKYELPIPHVLLVIDLRKHGVGQRGHKPCGKEKRLGFKG